jgi:hypothetical protein
MSFFYPLYQLFTVTKSADAVATRKANGGEKYSGVNIISQGEIFTNNRKPNQLGSERYHCPDQDVYSSLNHAVYL